MTSNQGGDRALAKPLRLWPGVVAGVCLGLLAYVSPLVLAEASLVSVIGGVAGGLAVFLWWLFYSRAPWLDRIGALVVMAAGLLAASRLVHESVANGLMGLMLPLFAIPVLGLTLVASAVATRRLSTGARRATMAAAILLACGAFTLIRTGGITGSARADLHWRWTPTPEERLLATADDPRVAASAPSAVTTPQTPVAISANEQSPAAANPDESPRPRTDGEAAVMPPPASELDAPADWPGFRGAQRDGVVRSVRIQTDWAKSPPVQLWRRPIGPGWSSFAVQGNTLYTQEQRGDDEIVAAYNVATGEQVWRHRDAARFWESNGGAGPRGTPTFHNGRVYSLGATGILNALDARTGSVIWSRNASADTGEEVPGWGFASSPLIVGGLVVVATGGTLAAYNAAAGRPRWVGPKGGLSYSSPQRVTIDGVEQIVLLNRGGATSVSPADGTRLWEHKWPGGNIVQPAIMPDGDVLIGAIDGAAVGMGTRRIAITHAGSAWTADERWTSNGLKPSFNDILVHEGHAYGFDGSILACIDLADGTRKWKGGRYGHGQAVLLADQDLLIVLSEEGELALVAATPDKFTELAKFPGIEGKTWNHPVLVGDVLLIRNGEEMAAFRLAKSQ